MLILAPIIVIWGDSGTLATLGRYAQHVCLRSRQGHIPKRNYTPLSWGNHRAGPSA